MTKKDYKLISEAINQAIIMSKEEKLSIRNLLYLVEWLLVTLRIDNKNFNPDKFKIACSL